MTERFRREFKKIDFHNNVRVTFSGGISTYPQDALDKTELFIKADKAMYKAKANGKDNIQIYLAS